MVYRTVTPLTAGVETVGLGLAQPNAAELCAYFNPISPNARCRLRATGCPSGDVLPNYKDNPEKWGVAKGGRHGKQYLEAD